MRLQDRDVEIAAAKRRAVLALMIAQRNTVVRIDRIIDELWREQAPDSARANVRTYVSALRRSLGPDRDRLSTCAESYMLRVADDELDVVRFELEASRGRTALREDAAQDAARHYRRALRLWRGEPLQDVPVGPSLQPYVTALAEARVGAREGLLEAQLRVGDTVAVIGGLRRLLTEHPTRESAWCALVRTLYECGDRAAALEAYQQARRILAATLGLDPGPALQAVHREILSGERRRAGPGRNEATSAGAVVTVPRQLPLAPAVLVGRDTELSWLAGTLARPGRADPRAGGDDRGPPIVVLHGLGGAGKSALAAAAARQVAREFPDGQLYVDLQGASPGMRPLSPAEALGRFLRALGLPEDRFGPEPDEAAAWFRTTTADRRILLVLDNAADSRQVRPLLPAGRQCAVLVTSRRPMSTLDGARQLRLGELSGEAAIELLGWLAGRERIDRHLSAAHDIARLCGHLPLAMRIIGVRLARNPEWSLPDAASRLRHARSRLDELGLADLDVRSTFEVGYRALTAEGGSNSPEALAARLFRRLGAVEFAEFTPMAAAALIGVDESEVRRILDALVDHGLVEHTGAGFRIHDLLRLLATEFAHREESAAAIDAAVRRVADSYIAFIERSSTLRRPQDDDPPAGVVTGGDLPGWRPAPPTAAETAGWFAAHLPALNALARQLAARTETLDLAYALVRPLHRSLGCRQPSECMRLYQPVLAGAERDGVVDLTASALCTLANCHIVLGRSRDAVAHAERARSMLPDVRDDRLRARILAVCADAHRRTGDPALALRLATEAVELYTRHERWPAVGICLAIAASAACLLERHEESLSMFLRSLALERRHGDAGDIGVGFDSIATLYLRSGRNRAAARCADWAVRVAERVGGASLVSALQTRSLAHQACGATSEAIADAERAWRSAQRLGASLELDALRNLAAVLSLDGDPRADEALRRADEFASSPHEECPL